jgi:hypothetical protein
MPFPGAFGQPGLDGVERGAVEDRLMLAGMNFATVNIPRQSRGLYFKSRSKRRFGVADAAPAEASRSKRLVGSLTRPLFGWAT